MGTQATLLQALQALYHDPNPETRGAANQWLQNFQHSIESWQVSDSLLHDPNSSLEVLIFCAQTLKTKIQRDFDDLPPNSRVPLRDSVLVLLKRFHQGPPSVRTQLCLALAALAIHISGEEWGNGGVMKWLKDELCADPRVTAGLLELLTVLPQEAYSHKIAARPERRRQFQKDLVSSAHDAFHLLTKILSQSQNSLDQLEQIISAFAAWLRLNYGMEPGVLASHPLVGAALSGLSFDRTFDASVEAVSELIRFTVNGSHGGLAEQMPVVQVVVPRVMALRPRFSASLKISIANKMKAGSDTSDVDGEEEDEEVMKGIAHVFTEMGESYVELIVTGSAEAMMIVDALKEVTSHPDDNIAGLTFNFWYRLSSALTKREYYKGFESETTAQVEMERRIAIFRQTFEDLVSLVSYRVKYPPGFESWRKDELADFKQTRYAVAEVLTDAAAVLGGERTIQLLANPLFQLAGVIPNGNSWDWQSLEASLYCIRGIAKAVPKTEATVMPRVMVLLPQLPFQPQLLYTAFLTIGAFADWLGAAQTAPALLPSLLDLLTKGFAIPDEPAAAAALAFKHVCDACRTSLASSSVDALVGVYIEAMSDNKRFHLSAEDELQVVEGLSMVVSAIPIEQSPQILNALCVPLATSLQKVITEAQQAGSTQHISSSSYTTTIDRLANIFRYVNQPEPLAGAFRSIWPLLRTVFHQQASDLRTMERLCRLCKYAIRVSERHLGDIVATMLEEVQVRFHQQQQSCFLYLASEVIKVFSGDPSCAAYLGNLITVLFGQAVNLLSSIQSFTAHPDIADDCFLLASRCARYCPQLLIHSSVFPSLVDCAMKGVTIQHREACTSILSFLQDVFHLSNSASGKPYKDIIDSVLFPRGKNLSRILIGALLGAVPESRVDEVMEALLSLAHLYGTQVVNWCQDVVRLIPSTVATEEEQQTFIQAISSAASGTQSSLLRDSLEELSDVCRRNKKISDLVQSVLQPQQLAS